MKKSNLLTKINEMPSEYSIKIGEEYSKYVSKDHKKKLGQFFTPKEIAQFMSSLIEIPQNITKLHILDPGCGSLILTCALIEEIISSHSSIAEFEVDGYESDPQLKEMILDIAQYLIEWAKTKSVIIKFNFYDSDFLLQDVNVSKRNLKSPMYDVIIANPPYFKIGKSDPRLLRFDRTLKGQQNIYSLFLLVSSQKLNPRGQLVFIIPRSFASGLYFESFRKMFLEGVKLEYFHVFNSRKDGFKKDKVLQENVIIKARKTETEEIENSNIIISASDGIEDLNLSEKRQYSTDQLLVNLGRLNIIHLPSNENEAKAMEIFAKWKENLQNFGFKVSTGPVVPFRSRSFLKKESERGGNCVPLLWMHNIQKMYLNWPCEKNNKEVWIESNLLSSSKTLPNRNYVILRRFSSKDEPSKLTASPFLASKFPFQFVGIENHLNYLHKPNGNLLDVEVFGMSILFNSTLFDLYLRSISGNTQVSATELNELPLPSLDKIKSIGEKFLKLTANSDFDIDYLVNTSLNLS